MGLNINPLFLLLFPLNHTQSIPVGFKSLVATMKEKTKIRSNIRSDRMKPIKSTHDDTRSSDQLKRKANKPFTIDVPSNR